MSTTLTLSETWLTTQTSVADRSAMATGSSPTGTEATRDKATFCADAPLMENISSRLSGVLTTKSSEPSEESAMGRTCPLSKVVNDVSLVADVAARRTAAGLAGVMLAGFTVRFAT